LIAGRPGDEGARGLEGRDGREGRMGGTGPMGAPGAQGPLGIEGPKGAMGTPGKPGTPGLRGLLGQSGKHLFDYIYFISACAHHCLHLYLRTTTFYTCEEPRSTSRGWIQTILCNEFANIYVRKKNSDYRCSFPQKTHIPPMRIHVITGVFDRLSKGAIL
jgi:hypothetical protein